VAGSRPLRVDHRGRPLPQLNRAAYSVRSGQLWVGSRSALGFDSRYFGSVPSTSVLAELHALYVVSP
jgi:type IV secretory pathway protease TraF